MINLGSPRALLAQTGFSEALAIPLTHSAGWPIVFFMNGLLAICGICREIMS
jgi:hypothetical protein